MCPLGLVGRLAVLGLLAASGASAQADSLQGVPSVIHAKLRRSSASLLQVQAGPTAVAGPPQAPEEARSSFAHLWTAVHVKRRPSARLRHATEALLELVREDPAAADAKEDAEEEHIVKKAFKTVKDKIWQVGREMCKGREESEHCKQFFDDEEEAEEEEAAEEAAAPEPAPAPATTEAPAPAPATTEAPAPEPATTWTFEASTKEATTAPPVTTEEASPAPKAGEGYLPSQGFRGPPVKHADGETHVADWGNEYPTLEPPKGEHKGAAQSLSGHLALALTAWLALLSA